MNVEAMKDAAGARAAALVTADMALGVGTGTTTERFIRALAASGIRPRVVVPSSLATGRALAAAGFAVHEPAGVRRLDLYVDGADEIDPALQLIKGGGGALVREKLLATIAERFVCIADERKLVPALGTFPLPVEVVPAAVAAVAERLLGLGDAVTPRTGFVSDNGNRILDVTGIDLRFPGEVEALLDSIPGVVGNGVFAHRRPDLVTVGQADGSVREVHRPV